MEYVEHLTWVLFLKFLDEQETIFEAEATIAGRPYTRILSGQYRWSSWVTQALGEKEPTTADASRPAGPLTTCYPLSTARSFHTFARFLARPNAR